jgi:predicted NUDIX family NTP pyrophosphohydrolase
MSQRSAGLALYRRAAARDGGEIAASDGIEVLIGHMGGPFWERKQVHAWSIPKGEIDTGEDARAAAAREFAEELGIRPPDVEYVDIGTVQYTSGKTVAVFAGEADLAIEGAHSALFEMEWPPHSGRRRSFPEFDRVAWVSLRQARELLVAGQLPIVDALEKLCS